jgi:oligoribonuclease
MKYVSIDIETTGLNPSDSDILEFVAVLDDTEKDELVKDLPYFRAVLLKPRYSTDAFCAHLHHTLWEEIRIACQKSFNICEGSFWGRYDVKKGDIMVWENIEENKASQFPLTLYTVPEMLRIRFVEWLTKQTGNTDSITPAGKNFGAFDLQFLNALPCRLGPDKWPFKHRALDPSSLYYEKGDMCLPNLQTCLTRARIISEVQHTALEDARDIVRVIRYALKNKLKNT